MKIDFPYKHYEPIEPAEVPDENPMGVYEPRALGGWGRAGGPATRVRGPLRRAPVA